MIGVLFSAIGAFFEELSASIGKREVARKEESVYAMGFLNAFWAIAFFLVYVFLFKDIGSLTLDAWPTFILRAIFSLSLATFTVHAIAEADRSTFSFIRTFTIPLLLVADLFLGIALSAFQLLGMLSIVAGLLFLYKNHGFSERGKLFTFMSAVNAALVIGLYKYNISHENSVELEQLLMLTIHLGFFYVLSRRISKERPLALIKKPILALQSGSIGIASVFESFAYVFAPASVILAATRSSSVLFSVLSGGIVFHEKGLAVKLMALILFVGGIALLALGSS